MRAGPGSCHCPEADGWTWCGEGILAGRAGGSTRGVYATSPRPQVPARYHFLVRRAWLVVGSLVIIAGAVWTAQGLNLPFAPRSFMTADRAWIVIGTITMLGGALVLGWAARRRA